MREADADGVSGESAKSAYYFFLSLFPLILVLFAVTGLFGGQEAFDWIIDELRGALPSSGAAYLGEFVKDVTQRSRPGMLSVGVLLTLWSASQIFVSLLEGLNAVYDVVERRSWWHRRLLAMGFLVIGLTGLLVGATALLAGPAIVDALGLDVVWTVLRWPLVFVMITAMLWLMYYVLPNRDQRCCRGDVLVGALVGAGLWLLATLGFRLYVGHFDSYSKSYGVVGAVVVLLVWLYLTALSILLGGEVAATLEQRKSQDWKGKAAPRGARPGGD